MLLNCMADIPQRRARFHHADALPHRLIHVIHQPFGQRRDLPNAVHFTGVGNITVVFQRNVDVNDHAGAQYFADRRNAVTDHFVNRGIEHIGKTVLSFCRRARFQLINDKGFGAVVNLHRGDTFDYHLIEHSKHLCQQRARVTHFDNLFRCFDHNLFHPTISFNVIALSFIIFFTSWG
ncbi:hypothetical protein D3C80_485650 [compost metagenome]